MDMDQGRESGFVSEADNEFDVSTGLTDVEILHVGRVNIIARGRRYGRLWLLKALRPELRTTNVSRRRLQKEFEIHSRLLHPGVAQVTAFEHVPGLGLCIVEEWIEGQTLAQLLRDGKPDAAERRRLMRSIIAAVAYLHSRGVVHRDLKPANVMVREAGGAPAIIDFGLADTADYAELKQGAGTQGYISPEQERNAAATAADDVYSLGVMMKELCPEYGRIAARCTGRADRRPHDAAALLRLIDRHHARRRRWCIAAACLLGAAACLAIGLHYRTLTRRTQLAQERVAQLTSANQQSRQHVALLTDSLTGVTARMNRAEDDIRRAEAHNQALTRAYAEGCRTIENTLTAFDAEIQPYLVSPGPEFSEKVMTLHNRLQAICDHAFNPADYPELDEADRLKLRDDLQIFYHNTFATHYTAWQARLASPPTLKEPVTNPSEASTPTQ